MTPERAIASLDRAVRLHGENTTLARSTGTNAGPPYFAEIPVRARVSPSHVTQGLTEVIFSPTDILAGDWANIAPNFVGDPNVPRITDRFIIAGRERFIQAVRPYYIDSTLVRIEADCTA